MHVKKLGQSEMIKMPVMLSIILSVTSFLPAYIDLIYDPLLSILLDPVLQVLSALLLACSPICKKHQSI